MYKLLAILLLSCLSTPAGAQTSDSPQVEITNGPIRAKIYLPDAETGYYRGTRFDWSGVIGELRYAGHNYYGPWFTKRAPNVLDFIYDGADIIAGPCSAACGPVEEFVLNGQALGYDEAKPGGTFVKVGVGVLKRPDDQPYSSYRLYEIVDHGKWIVRSKKNSVEFTQRVEDPSSGYGYSYSKTVLLVSGKPELILEHSLKNLGKRPIRTDVYNHNFLVLDKQPTGPDFKISVPFQIKTDHKPNQELAAVRSNEIVYLKMLKDRDTVATPIQGFGSTPADYEINIQNKKVGAGMKITSDRPLASEALWSIRSVLAVEPYVKISIAPNSEFRWKNFYTYYLLGSGAATAK